MQIHCVCSFCVAHYDSRRPSIPSLHPFCPRFSSSLLTAQVEQLERKEVTRLLALSDGDGDGLPLLLARLGLLPTPAVLDSARAQVR